MAIKVPTELLDGCVLGLLDHEDYYGYALTKKVQSLIEVASSTMYPVMRRLKDSQMVQTYDQPYKGRNRRYYQITDAGKQELLKLRNEWGTFQTGINEMLGGQADE